MHEICKNASMQEFAWEKEKKYYPVSDQTEAKASMTILAATAHASAVANVINLSDLYTSRFTEEAPDAEKKPQI